MKNEEPKSEGKAETSQSAEAETKENIIVHEEAVSSSTHPEKEKPGVPQKGKFPWVSIFYILFMLIFGVLSALLTRGILRFHPIHARVLQRDPVLPYYLTFIHYPKEMVITQGFAFFFFLIVLYLGVDLLFFRDTKGWKKAIFVLISIIVIIGGTECMMSFYSYIDSEMHHPHPTIFWELSPNLVPMEAGEDVWSNSHGFRSPEISQKKPKDQIRVMVLGDSSAFGFKIKGEETFGAVLVRMLNEKYKGKNIRYINAAVAGYTTYQARIFMEERGWKFSPDIIIIAFNDDGQQEWKQDVERAPHPLLVPIFRVLYKSNIYLSLKKIMLNSQIKRNAAFVKWPGHMQGKIRVPAKQLRYNIDTIMGEAKKRGSKVIVVSMPLQNRGGMRHRHEMKEGAEKAGYPFLDFLKGFKNYPAEEVFQDVMHPTAKGHKIIAEELYKIIINEGWLEDKEQ